MLLKLVSVLFLTVVIVTQAKPIDRSVVDESINEIAGNERTGYENLKRKHEDAEQFSALPANEQTEFVSQEVDTSKYVTDTAAIKGENGGEILENSGASTTTKVGPFSWFLTPLTQKVQFSPQSFFRDRLTQLKETLSNIGVNATSQNITGKQLTGANGLLHITGLNDSGFYTNRLEPAGFLGGNGWFANKGGILGGPGAILSTGSILTDYPTPYKR